MPEKAANLEFIAVSVKFWLLVLQLSPGENKEDVH